MSGTMIFVSSTKGLTLTHCGCHVFLANVGACFGEMRLVAWALQDAQSIAGSIIPAVVRG